MRKHLNIHVSGKVQGVFFRDSTWNEARRLDIKGKVRNEPDGSVYIEAEGKAENLETFLEWVRKGPPAAEVVAVRDEEADPVGYDDFSVEA